MMSPRKQLLMSSNAVRTRSNPSFRLMKRANSNATKDSLKKSIGTQRTHNTASVHLQGSGSLSSLPSAQEIEESEEDHTTRTPVQTSAETPSQDKEQQPEEAENPSTYAPSYPPPPPPASPLPHRRSSDAREAIYLSPEKSVPDANLQEAIYLSPEKSVTVLPDDQADNDSGENSALNDRSNNV